MTIQEFDFTINLIQVIIWEYNEALKIQGLLEKKQLWYDENQTAFWTDFYLSVFNLETANDFGLVVWSIILNLPLTIESHPDQPGKLIFGFGVYNQNFNNGNFSSTGSSIHLTTEEKRLVLRLRYYQIVSDCVTINMNVFIKKLFEPLGDAYVLDGFKMFIVVVYDFIISPQLYEFIKFYDLIPRGAGIGIKYRVYPRDVFGFGIYNQNFNNGNFYQEDSGQ